MAKSEMMANECRTATGSANEILQSHQSQNAKISDKTSRIS